MAILTHVKVEELCNWIKSKCGFDDEAATMYAAAILTLHILTTCLHLLYATLAATKHVEAKLTMGILATTRYAEALVGEGVDQPSDLGELEDGDWPSSIKPLHLKKLKAAAADV